MRFSSQSSLLFARVPPMTKHQMQDTHSKRQSKCTLSVYVCEAPSWRLELWALPLTPHKHLYLWSDYRTKGARWLYFVFLIVKVMRWVTVV